MEAANVETPSGSSSTAAVSAPYAPEITVNVYDLLPPGNLASFLWTIGGAVLHSGVVVGNREYAYGGHNRSNLSGVYWSHPGTVPPGGTFKCALDFGTSIISRHDVDRIIKEASQEFLGPSWNLLSNNCNHFTSYLCHRLTGKATPSWLNRAASIGISIPCVIPQQWLSPPDADTADGKLVEEEADDENTAMLKPRTTSAQDDEPDFVYQSSDDSATDDSIEPRKRRRRRIYRNAMKDKGSAPTDSSDRVVPISERAPLSGS